MVSRLMMPWVAGVSGQCSVITSDWASSSSSVTYWPHLAALFRLLAGVIGENAHAHGRGDARRGASDAAKADHAQGLARQFDLRCVQKQKSGQFSQRPSCTA